jgi:anti-anti-sigma regulatory factor
MQRRAVPLGAALHCLAHQLLLASELLVRIVLASIGYSICVGQILLASCRNFRCRDRDQPLILHKIQEWHGSCSKNIGAKVGRSSLLNVNIEKIGDLAVVECEGRLIQSEAAVKLREAVTSQRDARIVVLELSEVHAIEGAGLGMLVFLRRWAREHDIRFMLFDPSKCVQDGLKRVRSISEFYIPTLDDMFALLAYADSQYAAA